MATKAKKTKSGKWHCQAIWHDKNGVRHVKSFTFPLKRDCEAAAKAFELEKEALKHTEELTLRDAITKYIELKEHILSPATVRGYKTIRDNAFPDIMGMKLRNINSEVLQIAIRDEMMRPVLRGGRKESEKRRSPKSIKNSYGLIATVINEYAPGKVLKVDLPKQARRIRDLPPASDVYEAVKGTWVELPVLLAMWLSFTMSEIRGLTKSKSINGDYITIREVLVALGGEDVRKEMAKTSTRNRRHRMPPRIKELIDQVEGDVICPHSATHVLRYFQKRLEMHGVQKISFHDLRHLSMSIMALLNVPEKYAMERGGWATPYTMKSVYTEIISGEREVVDATINDYFERIVIGDDTKS